MSFGLDKIENLESWISAAVALVAMFALLTLLKKVVEARLERIARRTAVKFDDLILSVLRSTKPLFFFVLSTYFATKFLEASPTTHRYLHYVFLFFLFFQLGSWGVQAITFFVDQNIRRSEPGKSTTIQAIGYIGKFAVWTTIFLLLLKNLGVDVTALIAGLGVGGVAMALAVQNILGDLLASLSIVLDKPFVVGDSIDVGTDSGTVEYIGLKTTRLRSTTGEQLIFSNSDILRSRIRNFKRMHERRVAFTFKLSFDTPTSILGEIQEIVRKIVSAKEGVRFERCHLATFNNAAFEFEVVYWVLNADYHAYVKVHHEISLEILSLFRAREIPLADPAPKLFLGDKHGS